MGLNVVCHKKGFNIKVFRKNKSRHVHNLPSGTEMPRHVRFTRPAWPSRCASNRGRTRSVHSPSEPMASLTPSSATAKWSGQLRSGEPLSSQRYSLNLNETMSQRQTQEENGEELTTRGGENGSLCICSYIFICSYILLKFNHSEWILSNHVRRMELLYGRRLRAFGTGREERRSIATVIVWGL